LVGVVSILLVVVIWAGFRTPGVEESAFTVNQISPAEALLSQETNGFYLSGLSEPGGNGRDFAVSAVSLTDETSLRVQPSYLMPTIPAERVTAREAF
jgi:hypothetical protein